MPMTTIERFCACFEHQRFAELGALYHQDATFELFVGNFHERRQGPEAIVARYVGDYDPPPTFLRWEARAAPWGAIVQGDALQGNGCDRSRYRWVHVLTIEENLIVDDTVYCTGLVPFADGDVQRDSGGVITAPGSARNAIDGAQPTTRALAGG